MGDWNEFYQLAVFETNRQRMPERIIAARRAIEARLQELPQEGEVRQELEKMLKALDVLATESGVWKP